MVQKIGFIGTGSMGSALARAADQSGRTLLLANRTPEKAKALAQTLAHARPASNEEGAQTA